jgi:hypothetical protein
MVEMQYIAAVLFACAVLHTFNVKVLTEFANRYPQGSIRENLFHLLGEVEIVFGFWAGIFIVVWSIRLGFESAVQYLEGVNYTEAGFVFVIMCMAATKPVLNCAEKFVSRVAGCLPLREELAVYLTALILGPLLGSFITEPAAMTVTALILKRKYFTESYSRKFRYATLGLLFVNVSIGGTLTHFAAPPVLMVAGPWGWTTPFMMAEFGWRAAIAIVVGTSGTAWFFRREFLKQVSKEIKTSSESEKIPLWVTAAHFVFIILTIVSAHYMVIFIALFLFFLGWCAVAREYQEELRLKESLLVGFFLGGLVTLGNAQAWWLQPLLADLGNLTIFWGALSLTAITDNAALTYLGTLVPSLSAATKYFLVAGAVAGGGLTVIANAPNPAGYGILRESFGDGGINPLGLFFGALPYTLLTALMFLI